jgi:hypothetical protein
MQLTPDRFSRAVMASLADAEREFRLRELESIVTLALRRHTDFESFQAELYATINQLKALGHELYSWSYECEVEYWGGDYMVPGAGYELLLRSEFPKGIQFAWKNPEALHE